MNENPIITRLAEQILDYCSPLKIILFSKKNNLNDELASFKLCVIVPDGTDIVELETKLYLELDCENPFDVLLYNISEWENLSADEVSFAGKIARMGVVLYEL